MLALKTPEEIWEAIYLLKVRGAPAIGVAAAYGISVCMQKVDEVDDFYREFARVKNYLASLEILSLWGGTDRECSEKKTGVCPSFRG